MNEKYIAAISNIGLSDAQDSESMNNYIRLKKEYLNFAHKNVYVYEQCYCDYGCDYSGCDCDCDCLYSPCQCDID